MFSTTSFISCRCKLSCFEEIHPKKFISVGKTDLYHINVTSFLPIAGRYLGILDVRCKACRAVVATCNLEEMNVPLKLVVRKIHVNVLLSRHHMTLKHGG